MVSERRKRKLLGLGLDNEDGHVRVTRAENYHLVGGSESTHEQMQEKCAHFDEKLRKRGKQLEDLEPKEFTDIAAECDMPILRPRRP